MAFLDQDGLSVVLSSLKTKFTELFNTLYASINHNHSYTDLTNKPTIDTALSNTSTNAVQNKAIYTELGKKVNTSDIKDNLTSTDTNKPLSAAQGKALKDAIDGITTDIGNLGGGDMMKATYDSNNNGIVDNAEKLDGQAASYYENVYYGTCTTQSPSNNTYEVTITGKSTSSTKPEWVTDKTILAVNFSLSGGSQGSKLKVNGWTEFIHGLDGTSNATTIGWYSNQTVLFLWDGENWQQLTPTFASFTKYGISLLTQEIPSSENNCVLTSYKTGQAINAAKQEITNLIPTHLSTLNDDSTHRTITDEERTAWNAKSNFSGSYNDLSNKPSIPTNNNQLTNGAGYQTASQVDSAIKAATSKVIEYGGSTDIAGLPDLAVAANAYKMYNITEGFTTTSQFLEGADKSYPAGTNVVVIPNSAGTAYVFDIYTGSFAMSALTASEINAAFTAAGY